MGINIIAKNNAFSSVIKNLKNNSSKSYNQEEINQAKATAATHRSVISQLFSRIGINTKTRTSSYIDAISNFVDIYRANGSGKSVVDVVNDILADNKNMNRDTKNMYRAITFIAKGELHSAAKLLGYHAVSLDSLQDLINHVADTKSIEQNCASISELDTAASESHLLEPVNLTELATDKSLVKNETAVKLSRVITDLEQSDIHMEHLEFLSDRRLPRNEQDISKQEMKDIYPNLVNPDKNIYFNESNYKNLPEEFTFSDFIKTLNNLNPNTSHKQIDLREKQQIGFLKSGNFIYDTSYDGVEKTSNAAAQKKSKLKAIVKEMSNEASQIETKLDAIIQKDIAEQVDKIEARRKMLQNRNIKQQAEKILAKQKQVESQVKEELV